MWITICGLTLIIALLLKRLVTSTSPRQGYWKQYGILEIDASHVASELDVLLGRKDITLRDDFIYDSLGEGEKLCGVVERPRPILLLKDLDLVKKLYIKHFDHFIDRRQFFGAAREDSVLLKMLGNLKGEEWKEVRASVTPTFTTGKIRRMMDSINSVGGAWIRALKDYKLADDGGVKIDAYKCMSNYTADVIASGIFGLESGTVSNPNSLFSSMAFRLTGMSPMQIIKFTLSLRFPELFRFFKIDFLDMEALQFFENLLIQKLQERMENNTLENGKRNDFMQLLIETRLEAKKQAFLTDKVVRGQCLSFFFAGFRTTSTFLTFAIYALALHQDIQEKLRKEVKGIFKEDGGLDYDSLGCLQYLDMFLSEVLRKFPATLRLERECVTEFHDPDTGLFIPKGTFVGVPLHAIHNDKRFYETSEKFEPNHFLPEKKAERNPYAFIPFGIGPRNCIGMRFALLESKAAVAYLVHNFIVKPTKTTPTPLAGRRVNFQIAPPENLELKLIPI